MIATLDPPKIIARPCWEPDLLAKQLEFYRDPRQFLFAKGPRGCGKTWGIEHLVMKHCWRVNHAKVAIILLTKSTANEGIWEELTTRIYKEWIDANIATSKARFEYATQPKSDSDTKMNYFELFNRDGGISRVVVFPVKRAIDATAKLLSTQWSFIWISEAHLYKSIDIWNAAASQLRHPEVPFELTKVVCDLNPPAEGKSHWYYEITERMLEITEFPADWDAEDREAIQMQQRETGVYNFKMSDNPRLDRRRALMYRSTYRRNRGEYKRLVEGEDEEGGEPSDLFGDVWDRHQHVVGTAEGPETTWEVLAPAEGTHVERQSGIVLLLDGWDPGDTNHAWVACQPWTNEKGEECFDVIDELVILHGKVSVESLTHRVMEKRVAMEDFAGFKVVWKGFSDSSVERFRATAKQGRDAPEEDEHTDAATIFKASVEWLKEDPKRKGAPVRLIGAAKLKKKGWQKRRVNLLQQLLMENRIRVSAHCIHVIQMFERLRKNTQERASTYIAPNQDEKHAFDALSYLIGMRLIAELSIIDMPRVERRIIRA